MTFHDNSVFILLKFIIEFLIFILTNFVRFASWFCIINIWLQRSDGWTLDDNAEYLFYLFSHISWRICRISAESSSTWLFKIKVYTLDIKFSSWGWALSQSKVSACGAMTSFCSKLGIFVSDTHNLTLNIDLDIHNTKVPNSWVFI